MEWSIKEVDIEKDGVEDDCVWGDEEVRSEEVKSENRSFPHGLNSTSCLVVPFVTLILIHINQDGSKYGR